MALATPSFVFPHSVDALIESLPTGGWDEQTKRAVADLVSMLFDRDTAVEDFLGATLNGQKDVTTITATAGGATITYARTFPKTPVVVVSMGDSAAGKTVNVVDSSRGTGSFKVQVFDASTEVTSGNYKIAWIAA